RRGLAGDRVPNAGIPVRAASDKLSAIRTKGGVIDGPIVNRTNKESAALAFPNLCLPLTLPLVLVTQCDQDKTTIGTENCCIYPRLQIFALLEPAIGCSPCAYLITVVSLSARHR